jgi:uncharacterized membrane protein (Fun14 family)
VIFQKINKYTFATISKNLFLLCHYGVLCVDWLFFFSLTRQVS